MFNPKIRPLLLNGRFVHFADDGGEDGGGGGGGGGGEDVLSTARETLKGQGFEDSGKLLTQFEGKSHADTLVSYANLEKKMGTMVSIPGDDASEEVKREFHTRMGCPEKATDYKVTRPDMPKGMDYSEELEKAFREFAHGKGHNQATMKDNFDFYHKMIIGMHNQQTEDGKKAITEGMEALKTKWKDDNEKNHEIVKRGFKKYGTEEFAKMMEETEIGSHPAMVDFVFRILQLDKDLMEADYVPGGERTEESDVEKAKAGDPKARSRVIFNAPTK